MQPNQTQKKLAVVQFKINFVDVNRVGFKLTFEKLNISQFELFLKSFYKGPYQYVTMSASKIKPACFISRYKIS